MFNARFWEWINGGWVKLTLRPEQMLEWYRWARHDEGWSSESIQWKHAMDRVVRESETDGTDCDGRLTQRTVTECLLERLTLCTAHKSSEREWTPVGVPEWEQVEASQRDYFAEAMGY